MINSACRPDGRNRAREVLVSAHPSGDAVHHDPDPPPARHGRFVVDGAAPVLSRTTSSVGRCPVQRPGPNGSIPTARAPAPLCTLAPRHALTLPLHSRPTAT